MYPSLIVIIMRHGPMIPLLIEVNASVRVKLSCSLISFDLPTAVLLKQFQRESRCYFQRARIVDKYKSLNTYLAITKIV